MKIVMVNVRMDDRRLPPLGIAYIASYLQSKGLEVSIVDPTPRELSEGFSYIKQILSKKPDLVGFTANAVNAKEVMRIAHKIKEEDSDIKIVLGGPQATACPKDMLVDYVVLGEGEFAMYDLAMVLEGKKIKNKISGIAYKSGNSFKINKLRPFIKDLDSLPLPARDILPIHWYFQRDSIIRGYWGKGTSVLWGRGCPYNCLFCTSRQTFGRKLRLRNPIKIADEIEMLKNKYGLKHFYVLDDILNVNSKWTKEVCKEIASRKLDIIWSCQMRVDLITRGVLRSMKKSGCVEIEYGCESGSQKVLDAIRKNITVQQIIDSFKLSRKERLDTMAYFMIGNPSEKIEDIQKTINLAKSINADYYEFSISTPYPGSDLWRKAKEKGWLKSNDFSTAFHTGDKTRPVMEINFTKDELLKIKKDLYGTFKSKYFSKFMSQPSFITDLFCTLLSSPKTMFSVAKSIFKRDLQAAAWKFFHKQRLKE